VGNSCLYLLAPCCTLCPTPVHTMATSWITSCMAMGGGHMLMVLVIVASGRRTRCTALGGDHLPMVPFIMASGWRTRCTALGRGPNGLVERGQWKNKNMHHVPTWIFGSRMAFRKANFNYEVVYLDFCVRWQL